MYLVSCDGLLLACNAVMLARARSVVCAATHIADASWAYQACWSASARHELILY